MGRGLCVSEDFSGVFDLDWREALFFGGPERQNRARSDEPNGHGTEESVIAGGSEVGLGYYCDEVVHEELGEAGLTGRCRRESRQESSRMVPWQTEQRVTSMPVNSNRSCFQSESGAGWGLISWGRSFLKVASFSFLKRLPKKP